MQPKHGIRQDGAMRSAMLATFGWVPSASPERHAHSESVWSRWQADIASVIAKDVIDMLQGLADKGFVVT